MELQGGLACSEASQSVGKQNILLTAREAIRKVRVLYFEKPINTKGQHGDHQAKFRFGDLPPELQLQILELVILPGDVYLQVFTGRRGYGCRTIERLYRTVSIASSVHNPIPRWVQHLDCLHLKCLSKPSCQVCGTPKDQQPGFGLMAMGKFFYQKGYPMFYGQNTFHLAPGPLALSSYYFSRLRPRHQNLIKSLAVTFTIADLTIEAFQEVECELKRQKRRRNIEFFKEMPRQEQARIWTACSITVLESAWRQKLNWLLTWPNLDRVTLSGPTWDLVVNRDDMAALFRDPMNKPWKRLRCALGRSLQKSIEATRAQLLAGFEHRGNWTYCGYDDALRWKTDVKGVKRWLDGLGLGVRCKSEP